MLICQLCMMTCPLLESIVGIPLDIPTLFLYVYVSNYRKVNSIRRTKSQNVNVSRLVMQLSLPNPLKLDVKSIMKM